ncbi:proline racemase family protein [Neobacillus niacini]|uniref:proline racemase family protein n=1 Tax=Neobacillus niacini TaxID=86668 RepID=UPI00285B9977|nr:proline racemase family protein [Neobacillus niacini]MDR6997824.1 proline racemase/trans-L-3-hydroxyproline dehydratase [Neobacillus niacini]
MINFSQYIQTIDSHTMGEPTRIITGGAPRILGSTMMEKKQYLESKLDWLRKLLMSEPRGHKDMFGAIITDPCSSECDIGVIFMDSNGYLNMCGHGTIGTITTALNIGMIEPKNMIKVDTPAGIVECEVEFINKKVSKVTFTNVPAFVFAENVNVYVEGVGNVKIDVSFGGSIFAIVNAEQFGLKLVSEEQQELVSLGTKIKKAANEQLKFQHPLMQGINSIDLVEFSLKSQKENICYRNTVVFGDGQIDRSPCGTGTCAKMALLFNQGKLDIGEKFVHESIIDSKFIGQVSAVSKVGNYDAIIPQISGSAWITGMHQFIIESEDPYNEGFLLV